MKRLLERQAIALFRATLATAIILATFNIGSADASVIVTENTPGIVWLLNLGGQQGTAHTQVFEDHAVFAVDVFDATSLLGTDVVYITDFRGHSDDEVEALVTFVEDGGRLVIAADHTPSAVALDVLAERFDVGFGVALFGTQTAQVTDFNNDVTNGPAGVVDSFLAGVPNSGLTSTNPDFRVAALYPDGGVALGLLSLGFGEVVFLTDLNPFDDVRIGLLDNQILWTNLFDYLATTTTPVDVDILPTSCPNPFNLGRYGALPAAILGSDTLDVTDIDPTTIELSGPAGTAAPVRWSIEDVAAPGEFPQPEMRDDCGTDGPDGFNDLTLKFDAREVAEALGAVSEGDVVIVTISAETTEGTPVSGVDIVWIRASRRPDRSGGPVGQSKAPLSVGADGARGPGASAETDPAERLRGGPNARLAQQGAMCDVGAFEVQP